MSKLFLPYQQRWLKDKSQTKLWEKSRRIGATYVQAYEDVQDCIKGVVPKVWFSSADDTAAKEYIDYCGHWAGIFKAAFDVAGEEVVDDVLTHVVKFKNGSKITALASNPKSFRSKGGKTVLDEFGFHDDAQSLWKAANATGGVWDYPIRILSTHNGKKSLFFRFIESITKGELDWSHHITDIYKAVDEGLLDKIKGRPTTQEERAAFIAKLRRDSFLEDTFLEEFCCIAVDSSTAFLTYELIRACEDGQFAVDKKEGTKNGKKYTITTFTHKLIDLASCTTPIYVGFDVARKKDLSVIWIATKKENILTTAKVIILEKTPFKMQEEALYKILSHPFCVRACIDNTGIGAQLAEDAADVFGSYKVEEFTFTAVSKSAIMFGLLGALEEQKVTTVDDKEFREDFHSLKKSTGASGAVRFDVERNETDGHGDRAIACALCVEASKTEGGVWAYSKSHRA